MAETSSDLDSLSLLAVTNQLLESERTIDEVYQRAMTMVRDPQVSDCLARVRLCHLEDILSLKQAAFSLGGEPSAGFDSDPAASQTLNFESGDIQDLRLLEALLTLEQRRRDRLNDVCQSMSERGYIRALFDDGLVPRASELGESLAHAIARIKREIRVKNAGNESMDTENKPFIKGDDIAASPAN